MECEKNLIKYQNSQHAMIISGDSLYKVQTRKELYKKFIEVAEEMNVVIACRVSPKQKAEVV
jgi:magnesium-transporting ATPase (P-type)